MTKFDVYYNTACDIMYDLMEDFSFAEAFTSKDERAWLQYINNNWDRSDVLFAKGCTKGVIIPIEECFVLKFSFDCEYYEGVDYCALEAKHYKEAEAEGLEEYFAWCYFLQNFSGVDVYIMEKCDVDEEKVTDMAYSLEKERHEDELENGGYTEEEWEEECNDGYSWYPENDSGEYGAELVMEENFGENEYGRVNRFFYDHHISDIHCGNIGFSDFDKRLCLTDYSGFGISKEIFEKIMG